MRTKVEDIKHFDIRIPVHILIHVVANNHVRKMKDGEHMTFMSDSGNELLVVKRTGIQHLNGLDLPYDSFDFIWNPDD